MDYEIYFNKIKECGWFDYYSDELMSEIREQLSFIYSEEMSFEDKDDVEISCLCLGLGLIGDDLEGVWDEGDYTKSWIIRLAQNSKGIFNPKNIIEKWEVSDSCDDEFVVSISFESKGKTYNTNFEHGGGWTNTQIFVLLNEAINDLNNKLCLIEITCSGTDNYYAYTSLDAYIEAYKKGLLPQWRLDPFDPDDSLSSCLKDDPLNLSWHISRNPTYYRKKNRETGLKKYFKQAINLFRK